MDIEAKIKELYELHRTSGLYNDSFENVIFKLTNAYDYSFLELSRKARMGMPSPNLEDYEDFDRLRQAYRACIKFTYEDCNHGNFIQKMSLPELKDYQKEMRETIQFNFIRNIVDRYRLGRFTAFDSNGMLSFKHVESDRSIIYDAYQRNIADEIPGSKETKDNANVFDFNLKIIEIARNKPEFQSKKIFKPVKHLITELVNELVPYYLGDLDVGVTLLKGKDYYLAEYLLVFCYLVAIGIYKTAYLISLRFDNEQVYQPSIVYPKERLIEDIVETFGMPEETVKKVISDLTYDYDFHKDRLTIYQPLFEVGDNYLCSTYLLFHSYVIDKVMKYYDIKGTNKEHLTLYHRYMSNKMNHRMAEYLPYMYPNLQTYENCTLRLGGASKSEIDLIVVEETTNTVALIELKNYTPVDNEEDMINKERRINEAIQSRLIKDKLVVENIEKFLKQNNIPLKYSKYNYFSLLITNSSVGGVGIKESIKVIDEPLFYNLLHICQGSLLGTISAIDSGEFFKILESVVSTNNLVYEYKGLKVEIIYK